MMMTKKIRYVVNFRKSVVFFQRLMEKGDNSILTCGQFDIKDPHAFVFPWRSVFPAPSTCTAQVIGRKEIFGNRVHDAGH
jgi:hypothetical protein